MARSAETTASKAARLLLFWAVATVVAAELWAVQFATSHMLARDGYYHARYAHLMPSRGLSRSFEWTRYSFWRDRFSDKELLFHAWLAPWCRSEATMNARAKLAAWLLALATIGAFGVALRTTGVRVPALWALALAGAGSHFVYRLSECRPHVLSIGFFVVGTALLLQGRWKSLAVCGFLYAWSYAAPHMLVAVAAVHSAATWIHDGRPQWRGVAATTVGVAAGLLLHPYSPNSIHMWWVQNVVVLGYAWSGASLGFHWGTEFDSAPARSLVMESTGTFLGFAAGIVLAVVAARDQRVSSRTFSLLLIALACFGLYCLSGRFIEYFAPASVWLLASAGSDLVEGRDPRRPPCVLLAGFLAVCLVVSHVCTFRRSTEKARGVRGPVMSGAARWIRGNVRPGATVGHLNWGDFVQLFAFDPDHRYINGLDPAFMLVTDPRRIRYWEDVSTGRSPLRPAEFAETFGTDVLVISKEAPHHVRICDDALLERLYEDGGAIVYALSR